MNLDETTLDEISQIKQSAYDRVYGKSKTVTPEMIAGSYNRKRRNSRRNKIARRSRKINRKC